MSDFSKAPAEMKGRFDGSACNFNLLVRFLDRFALPSDSQFLPAFSSRAVQCKWHGDALPYHNHGFQMAIAGLLDCMCLVHLVSRLWLRYPALQNLIPSYPWIAPVCPPPWRNPCKERKGSNFAIRQPLSQFTTAKRGNHKPAS